VTAQSIRSAEALSKVLDEVAWFELAYCVSLSPPPGGPVAPERVELVLRDEITASTDEDVRTFRMSRLTATGIREWSFSGEEEFYWSSDYSVEYAELIDTPDGFGLAFDVPTLVCLVADAFEYERLPDETEPMPIWLGTSFTVMAPRIGVPPPAQWVEAFAREGTEVGWRVLGGPAHPGRARVHRLHGVVSRAAVAPVRARLRHLRTLLRRRRGRPDHERGSLRCRRRAVAVTRPSRREHVPRWRIQHG